MSIIRYIFLLLVLAFAVPVGAAPTREEMQFEEIRNNDKYIYGEGFGSTKNKASSEALDNLMSKISVHVSNQFNLTESETVHDGEVTSVSRAEIITESYSRGRLENSEELVVSSRRGEYHVVRFVDREQLRKMFEQRATVIKNLYGEGLRSRESGNIENALRSFYHALMLLDTHPEPNKIEARTDADGTHYMREELRKEISYILTHLNVSVSEVDGDEVHLYFRYAEKPVSLIAFSYSIDDGATWSGLVTAKDGAMSIDVPEGTDGRKVKIRYAYRFTDQLSAEMENLSPEDWERAPNYDQAATVSLTNQSRIGKATSKVALAEQHATHHTNVKATEGGVADIKPCRRAMESIVSALQAGKYDSVKDLFTPDGWEMMNGLLKYGKAKLLGKQEYSFADMPGGRTVCRSLVMTFSFPNNHRIFTEDVTFTFNSDRKIETVAFGLDSRALLDIFNNTAFSDEVKMSIAAFLENYKTAFALKRFDYINSIFDENAYIVVGHVVQKAPEHNLEGLSQMGRKIIEQNHITKQEYMTRLKRCFDSQAFVNIRFTDNDVVPMNEFGEYGIQIHQDYFSSTYCDTGYLFLSVDLNDTDKPLIKIRMWQPERNPDITPNIPPTHRDYGIYAPGHF